jgi:high-affinity iron transporter
LTPSPRLWYACKLKMKLKFNFIMLLVPLLGGLLAACAGAPAAPPAPAADGGDGQRLVALLDYISGDYRRAVRARQVLVQSEYEEQIRFAGEARGLARGLLGPSPSPDDPLLAGLAEVEAQVRARAEPEAVAELCRSAREQAVARFGLRTMPVERPSLPRAQRLYAESCAPCHGAQGNADTERARSFNPPPARFRDPSRLGEMSPYRIYNALTFGVPGTAMASFDSLSPPDRWSLAFYVFRLGHEGEKVGTPVAMTLADMAGRSDQEILAGLQAEKHPDPDGTLVYLRREAAFTEPPAGVGIDRTREMVRQAVRVYTQGRPREADRLALDAYLSGFEPLEIRLRARDAAGTLQVETGFRDLRAAMVQGETADHVRARAQALDGRLAFMGEGGRRPLVPLAAGFLIYFREGVEAALLVGALLAGLRRLGRPDAARFIHAGWLLALPAGVVTWWVFDRAISLGTNQRELMEALIALLAAVVLFSVSFWMISKAESRHWMGYLKQKLEAGLSRRSLLVLSGLAFLAVYREAAETILFTQALLLESDLHRADVWTGAFLGLLAVVVAAVLMNRTVLRLPLGPFFAVSSLLLCGLAISFAGAGIYELVAAGYLTPRPVPFPEVPWMGIHPDLTGLLVQLTILLIIAGAGLLTLRRRPLAQPGGHA